MAVIYNHTKAETITGTSEFDLIVYDSETHYELGINDNDLVLGMDGDDVIHMTPGTDTIDGGEGWDEFQLTGQFPLNPNTPKDPPFGTITFEISSSYIDLAQGTYSATFKPGKGVFSNIPEVFFRGTLISINFATGSSGADTIAGSSVGYFQASRNAWREDFNPGGGDDLINGRGGFDVLRYDLNVTSDKTRKQGIVVDCAAGTVDDGLGGKDRFLGIDYVIGTEFADVFKGDDKAQEFWGDGGGNDSFFGGGGIDRVDFWLDPSDGAVIDLTTGTGTNESGDAVVLSSIEWLVGGDADDTLLGSTGSETLNGGWGGDLLDGRGGQDVLIGSNDDDTMVGGVGNDTLDYSAENGTEGVVVFMTDGTATDTYGSSDTLSEIEAVIGTLRNDTLAGDAAANVLLGIDGDDRLSGGDRADILGGGVGNDALFGNDGEDDLQAGVGNDFADGGAGDDQITGDDGNDRLFGGTGRDLLDGGDGVDFLRDKDSAAIENWAFISMLARLKQGLAAEDSRLDTLRGGDGADVLDGYGLLYGGEAGDVLNGIGYLDGGAGNDKMTELALAPGAAAAQTIMVGGAGRDTLTETEAGIGTVTACYAYAGAALVVNLSTGIARISVTDVDRLMGVHNILGTRFADVVTAGTDTDGFVDLGAGDDKVTASGSSYFGVDLGLGNDTVSFNTHDLVQADLGDGDDKITIRKVLSHEVDAGAGNDTLVLQDRSDEVDITTNHLFGGLGDDNFTLRNALTVAEGGRGDDTFIIIGNSGAALAGGKGSDSFIFKPVPGKEGPKVIIDDFTYDGPDHDLIDLRALHTGLTYAELRTLFAESERPTSTYLFAEVTNPSNGKPMFQVTLYDMTVEDLRPEMFLL